MAKPIYGGWVTFTAHLSLKYNYELFKVGKRTEPNKRDYGYGIEYKNMRIDDLLEKNNLLITAVDKHYWKYLYLFPKGTRLVIHDPTELKGKDNKIVELLDNFEIITIRKTVQDLLLNKYNKKSTFLYHPFYQYPKTSESSDYYSLSISRIDFDKNTDLILKANKMIKSDDKKIQIFGAENRLYVHHKLKDLEFPKYWHGKFPKTLPLSYKGKDLLNNCHYIIDMSIIKGDGGGTQYTFLEAIYHNCALILHKEWVQNGDLFKKDYNCYVVGYTDDIGKEIADIINTPLNNKYKSIIKNASKILKSHTQVKWFCE
ncbi:hypothetical protein CMK20_18950 [Candidatus Poribacteria bacterium]|nr:hypothetical protein [Candidatus Poribacteria bacterium]